MNNKSGFKKYLTGLNIISIAISIVCALCYVALSYTTIFGEINLAYVTLVIYLIFIFVIAVQLITMVGVLVFQLRRLGEYIGYYLGAILSLCSFAGTFYVIFALLAKELETFN